MDFCDFETGDGCGHSFPTKSSPGLCVKCTKLSSLTEGSADYEQWKVCPFISLTYYSMYPHLQFPFVRPSSNARIVGSHGGILILQSVDDVVRCYISNFH